MPKIPRSVKKQVKSSYSKKESGIGLSRMRWSYYPGDLVRQKANGTWGIIVETIHEGVYVYVLTPSGKQRIRSSKLEKIQASPFDFKD